MRLMISPLACLLPVSTPVVNSAGVPTWVNTISGSAKESVKVSTSNYKHSYFTPAQCVAHRASSGCGLEAGELLGLGTISSPVGFFLETGNECLQETCLQ